jgi:hypothetical protein
VERAADRNPYVILGIDYGANLSEARRAFVKRVRRVKGESDPTFTEDEVTAALHQLEQIARDPENAVEVYRVPGNPAVFREPSTGLFAFEAKPISRRTQTVTAVESNQFFAELAPPRIAELSRGITELASLRLKPYEGDR